MILKFVADMNQNKQKLFARPHLVKTWLTSLTGRLEFLLQASAILGDMHHMYQRQETRHNDKPGDGLCQELRYESAAMERFHSVSYKKLL